MIICVKNGNYKKIIPEAKGIIAIRVRRTEKEYVKDNPWLNGQLNLPNTKTYILIRNGDCLYRIWADINIYPRLFPTRNELMDLKERWDKIDHLSGGKKEGLIDLNEKDNRNYRFGDYVNIAEEKDRIDNITFRYKQQLIMLQGLLDRTEVFHPLPGPISLMGDESHNKGLVRFIYDDEIKLPDSRVEFWDYHKQINASIQEGSRVFIASGAEHDKERLDDRFAFTEKYNLPNSPQQGIYTVELYSHITSERVYEPIPENELDKSGKQWNENNPHEPMSRSAGFQQIMRKYLSIKYNPGDEVRNLC